MKALMLAAVAILTVQADFARGTAIVIIRRASELVVAADSKTTRTDDRANVSVSCKITSCGHGYFAAAGQM